MRALRRSGGDLFIGNMGRLVDHVAREDHGGAVSGLPLSAFNLCLSILVSQCNSSSSSSAECPVLLGVEAANAVALDEAAGSGGAAPAGFDARDP